MGAALHGKTDWRRPSSTRSPPTPSRPCSSAHGWSPIRPTGSPRRCPRHPGPASSPPCSPPSLSPGRRPTRSADAPVAHRVGETDAQVWRSGGAIAVQRHGVAELVLLPALRLERPAAGPPTPARRAPTTAGPRRPPAAPYVGARLERPARARRGRGAPRPTAPTRRTSSPRM